MTARSHALKLFLPVLVTGLLSLPACSSANHQYDFITLTAKDKSMSLQLTMGYDAIRAAFIPTFGTDNTELNAGVHLKWGGGGDKTIVSMQVFGTYLQTPQGIVVNDSKKADVLPAYQADTAIRIIQNDDSKVILGKQIGGVNYTLTFRFYPDSSVKYISVTNADLYTEDDKDFP